MAGCQVIPCTKISILSEALKSVRKESNACILSCISNFLTASDDAGSSVAFRVEPIMTEFLSAINDSAQNNPDRFYLVAPPMYRRSPLWYRDGISEILTKFSTVMKARDRNVHLMSSFSTPELVDD